MAMAVNERSTAIVERAAEWTIIEALMGGTLAMRAAGTALLPKWPAEAEAAYRMRLATATLFPAYRRTVTVMAGKPFSKPLALGDASDATLRQWEPFANNVDRRGTSLHVFAASLVTEAIAYGLAGIYVDFPKRPPGVRTIGDAARANLRPYLVPVHHGQLLGHRLGADGQLDMMRFLESATVPDGEWGTKEVTRVRVLRRGSWELFEAAKSGGAWVMIDRGETANMPCVPFVPVYGRRAGYMLGKAPMAELAHLNVKHWQSQSDQDTILHAARVPILAARGVDDNFSLVIGSSTAVNLGDSPNGELKWVEHTGASIEAGRKSLKDLEEQMIQSGAELLVKREGNRTATESANDAEANKCDLQRITEDAEDALDQALVYAGMYAGLEPPSVQLYKDFGAATLSDASAQLIRDLQQGGLISKRTAITEFQRRGVLADTVDADEEAAAVAEDGPALGTVTATGASESEGD